MDRRTFLRYSITTLGAIGVASRGLPAFGATQVVTVPSSIPRDGSADVTQRLRDFFDSVGDNSTIQFPAGGRYRVDGQILLHERHGLVIDGNGSQFFGTEGFSDPHWLLRGGTGLVMRNCAIRGANPNGGVDSVLPVRGWGYQHAIAARGVDGITVENVTVSDVYGDLFYAGYGPKKSAPCQGLRLLNFTGARSGRNGVSLNNTRDVLIQGCSIGAARRNTFNLEPVHPYSNEHVSIIGNTIGDRRGGFNFVAATRGANSDVLVKDNFLTARDLQFEVHPPYGMRNVRWMVDGNRAPNALTAGSLIEFRRCDGVELVRNENPFNSRYRTRFATFYDCTSVSVHDNSLPGVDTVARSE